MEFLHLSEITDLSIGSDVKFREKQNGVTGFL